VDDEAAATVEDGAEEVKGAGDIEIADIDMPVLVGAEGCSKPCPFLLGTGEAPARSPLVLRTR